MPPHPHNDLKTLALQLFCNTSLSDLNHKYERCKLSVKNLSERKLQLFVNIEKINISQGQHVSRRRAGICCGMAMKSQNTQNDAEDGKGRSQGSVLPLLCCKLPHQM